MDRPIWPNDDQYCGRRIGAVITGKTFRNSEN